MVMLGVGRYSSPAVVVEVDHTAGSEEGHHTAVPDTDLGAVVLHKMIDGKEDTLVAVNLGYAEEVHMAAAEEGMLVVGGMDCGK